MTRRSRNGDSWIKSQLTVGNLMAIGAFFVTMTGFYFTTNANFDVQAKAISALERKISEGEKKEDRKDAATVADRDNLRKEVHDLSKTTAVLSAQLVTTNSELMKLGQKIDSIVVPAGTVRR